MLSGCLIFFRKILNICWSHNFFLNFSSGKNTNLPPWMTWSRKRWTRCSRWMFTNILTHWEITQEIPGTKIEGAGNRDQLQGPPVIGFIEKVKVQNEGSSICKDGDIESPCYIYKTWKFSLQFLAEGCPMRQYWIVGWS